MRGFTIAAVVLTGVFLSLVTKKLIYPEYDNCKNANTIGASGATMRGRFHANVRSV